MSVANPPSILKLLSELSAAADKVVEEKAPEFKLPCLLEWISIVKNKADSIVEGKTNTESEEIPSLVSYIRGSNKVERGPRISAVLTEMQRLHLHKTTRKSRKSSILRTSLRRKKSSVKERVSTPRKKLLQQKAEIVSSENLDTSTSSIERKETPFSSTSKTPVSKRKSSSKPFIENVKKPKLGNADELNAEKPIQMSGIIEKPMKAKNSSVLSSNYANIKSSNGLNVPIPKENRVRSKMERKQDKAVENRKNIMSLRQQKLEENKRTREEKMEKTIENRLKLEKQKQLKGIVKLRSEDHSSKEDKSLTSPKTMKKVDAENREENKQTSSGAKKLPLHLKKMANGWVLKNNEKTPNSQKNIKKPETNLNSTYVATGVQKPSAMINKGKTLKDVDLSIKTQTLKNQTVKPLIEKQLTSSTPAKKGESYAITPARSSFVSYDISEIRSDSEDDEQEANSKPIPSWATGVRLRNALLQQHHHPIDTDELFGNVIDLPDLSLIMGVKKKHYSKRTSSAVWNSSFSFS